MGCGQRGSVMGKGVRGGEWVLYLKSKGRMKYPTSRKARESRGNRDGVERGGARACLRSRAEGCKERGVVLTKCDSTPISRIRMFLLL